MDAELHRSLEGAQKGLCTQCIYAPASTIITLQGGRVRAGRFVSHSKTQDEAHGAPGKHTN